MANAEQASKSQIYIVFSEGWQCTGDHNLTAYQRQSGLSAAAASSSFPFDCASQCSMMLGALKRTDLFIKFFFCSALLWDETEETFTWLFNTWLESMSGKPPSIIITDQDAAINNAIAEILPNAIHHCCIWHIEKKFPETLKSRVSSK